MSGSSDDLSAFLRLGTKIGSGGGGGVVTVYVIGRLLLDHVSHTLCCVYIFAVRFSVLQVVHI